VIFVHGVHATAGHGETETMRVLLYAAMALTMVSDEPGAGAVWHPIHALMMLLVWSDNSWLVPISQ